jgi:hypothetical protein
MKIGEWEERVELYSIDIGISLVNSPQQLFDQSDSFSFDIPDPPKQQDH